MTATLENSTTELQFNYAENIKDGRGITFGCIGFCTGTYDGNILIKHYTELNPNNILAKYIPALNKIDSDPHKSADGDGNASLVGLSGFINDVKNCTDPLFKQAQLDKLDELYYNPAMKIADNIGTTYNLTKAFIYDMCVRHGPDGAQSIVSKAGTSPKNGMDETTYLKKLFSIRDDKLKREGLGDTDRDNGYKKILTSGNVDLKTPFKFVAYGDSFTIDGDLDVGTPAVNEDVEDSTTGRVPPEDNTTVVEPTPVVTNPPVVTKPKSKGSHNKRKYKHKHSHRH